ncbi:GbsR/MarR family transcriptional regulator [Cycloclasticus pugetii]|uniref:GbsR/MarR family transcriptional regulator n=1 Tax=Cycloclasticus pugetii TaxID=34068 RepID=UPI003A95A000
MKLSPLVQSFVFHFGEMGSRWGINRTVGQIYALIYLSEKPLNADQLVEALGFSRSNIAMGIKELVSMNLVMLRHIPSDRKDYYTTHEDIWEIVRNLVEERKKREIDPTLSMLRSVMMETPSSEEEKFVQDKMREMHDLIEMLTKWYDDMQKLETERLVNLLKMGAKVYSLYQMKDKLTVIPGGKKSKNREKEQ